MCIRATVCLLVAVSIALISVTSSLPEENYSPQQALKLPWETSHYQQRNDDEHSTSHASSHLTLGPSSLAVYEDYKHGSLWNDESANISVHLEKKYRDLLKTINNNKLECKKTVDCKLGTACCWIPGKASKKQCTETNHGNRYLFHYHMNKITRGIMLNFMKYTCTISHVKTKFGAVVLPVGQGDCVVMCCPNGNLVMFDCGSRKVENDLTAEEVKTITNGRCEEGDNIRLSW